MPSIPVEARGRQSRFRAPRLGRRALRCVFPPNQDQADRGATASAKRDDQATSRDNSHLNTHHSTELSDRSDPRTAAFHRTRPRSAFNSRVVRFLQRPTSILEAAQSSVDPCLDIRPSSKELGLALSNSLASWTRHWRAANGELGHGTCFPSSHELRALQLPA